MEVVVAGLKYFYNLAVWDIIKANGTVVNFDLAWLVTLSMADYLWALLWKLQWSLVLWMI